MEINKAIESVKNALFWGNWSVEQAEALRTLLLEAEKTKLLEEEIKILKRRLND